MMPVAFTSSPSIRGLLHSHCTFKLVSSSSHGFSNASSIIPKNVNSRPKFILASSSATVPIPDRDSQSLRDPIPGSKPTRKQVTIAGVIQDELLDPERLADPDSRFCDFQGVKIHHHLHETSSPSSSPVILLHGFAASVSSWKPAMKPLSESIKSPVLAFDRPAFGLTSRVDPRTHISNSPSRINPYSIAFSVLLTLHFIDSLTPNKAVLIGHSAGCVVAVNTYFKAPHRIAALILVAPAIVAPNQAKSPPTNLFFRFFASVAKIMILILKTLSHYASVVYKKALSFIFNSSFFVFLVPNFSQFYATLMTPQIRVSIDKFGVAAVRNAWYDASQITEESINGYLKCNAAQPLRAKGWDKALAAFVAAMVCAEESRNGDSLATRIRGISCPVLVITGDSDRLVPARNARKLAQVIPGCSFKVFEKCGHLPHEEKVDQFVSAVSTFLRERL